MNWRRATWARWLGWTVVFGLVVGGSALAYSLVSGLYGAEPPALLTALFAVPSLVAPVLIGVRFPSLWWGLGPPTLFLTLATALFVSTPGRDLVLGWVIIPLVLVSGIYGLLALLGVWWGKRREDDFPFRGDDVSRNRSRFEQS
jgi:hypothetical protein